MTSGVVKISKFEGASTTVDPINCEFLKSGKYFINNTQLSIRNTKI